MKPWATSARLLSSVRRGDLELRARRRRALLGLAQAQLVLGRRRAGRCTWPACTVSPSRTAICAHLGGDARLDHRAAHRLQPARDLERARQLDRRGARPRRRAPGRPPASPAPPAPRARARPCAPSRLARAARRAAAPRRPARSSACGASRPHRPPRCAGEVRLPAGPGRSGPEAVRRSGARRGVDQGVLREKEGREGNGGGAPGGAGGPARAAVARPRRGRGGPRSRRSGLAGRRDGRRQLYPRPPPGAGPRPIAAGVQGIGAHPG